MKINYFLHIFCIVFIFSSTLLWGQKDTPQRCSKSDVVTLLHLAEKTNVIHPLTIEIKEGFANSLSKSMATTSAFATYQQRLQDNLAPEDDPSYKELIHTLKKLITEYVETDVVKLLYLAQKTNDIYPFNIDTRKELILFLSKSMVTTAAFATYQQRLQDNLAPENDVSYYVLMEKLRQFIDKYALDVDSSCSWNSAQGFLELIMY